MKWILERVNYIKLYRAIDGPYWAEVETLAPEHKHTHISAGSYTELIKRVTTILQEATK